MENELKNNLLIFYFIKFIKIMRNKSYKLKKLNENENEIEKKI
jgi:hypothetical protein